MNYPSHEKRNKSVRRGFVNRIYPTEVEIKDTTGTVRFTSYFDLHLAIDSNCQLRTTF
jgi:hypothetical protein